MWCEDMTGCAKWLWPWRLLSNWCQIAHVGCSNLAQKAYLFDLGVIGNQEDADRLGCGTSCIYFVADEHCPVLGGHSKAATATQWLLEVIVMM